jgi:hypothetical protein
MTTSDLIKNDWFILFCPVRWIIILYFLASREACFWFWTEWLFSSHVYQIIFTSRTLWSRVIVVYEPRRSTDAILLQREWCVVFLEHCAVRYVEVSCICVVCRRLCSDRLLKITVFWDVAPCSLVEIGRRFGVAYRLLHQGDEIAVIFSKTSIITYQTIQFSIPEDSRLYSRRRENLKSHEIECYTPLFSVPT